MSFGDDVRLKAQSALEHLLNHNNPSLNKSPETFLTYLYQHAIITLPKYEVIPKRKGSPYAVSCKLGDIQTTGFGNTRKAAKANAAEQVLEQLRKLINISRMPSSIFNINLLANAATSDIYAPVFSTKLNGDPVFISQNCIPSSSAESEMKNSALNAVQKLPLPNRVVEPQMAQEEVIHARSKFNIFSLNTVKRLSDSNATGNVSVNKFKIASLSETGQSNGNSNVVPRETFQTSLLPKKHKSQTYAAFFDPFFNERPSNGDSAMIVDVKETESCDQMQEDETSCDEKVVPSVVENKNVFALLQKKTQKQLKLIPRFRIEATETGFQCNVQLGSFFASGEGKNKKVAKTRAAISLLDQMNDI